jgi:mannose-1-phosphate guanylyltransferase
MIERMVGHLAGHGITEVVLSLGFMPDAFTAAYPDGTCAGTPLHYAVEPEPLDTAGAIAFAAAHAGIDASSHDSFLVQNGDILTDLDVGALVASHREAGAEATIALTAVDDPSRYGVVATDGTGRVLGFVEKPAPGEAPSNLVNAGTYVLEPSVLRRITPGVRVSVERQVFPEIATDGTLYAVASDAYWIDTGTPVTYLRANLDTLADGVSSVVDEGATIAASAVVERSVVRAGARIGENAVVQDSIVGPGASVGASAHVSDHSVLGTDAVVAEGEHLSGQCRPEVA